MKLPSPLWEGILLRRYKRFLADVRLMDGRDVTAHVPNTGTMLGVSTPGTRVWLSHSSNPSRKTAFTWELSTSDAGTLVAVNTGLANQLAEEAIRSGVLAPLVGYDKARREVRFGRENSRIDLLLEGADGRCWVEVKSVTLARDGVALFPDAVTLRGQKHLRELMALAQEGERAAMLYCIQRADVQSFAPAGDIDPGYARLLRQTAEAGVEILACRNRVTIEEILPETQVPVSLGPDL